MNRLWPRTQQEQIDYHLADGRAPEFDTQQPGRVDLARFLVDKILKKDLTQRPLTFVELGCGAGDITGPYSLPRLVYMTAKENTEDRYVVEPREFPSEIEVHGWDVTPAAQEACNRRWPEMQFHLQPVEEATPIECDLLVMCEFLEHVHDPWAIVRAWMPKTKFAIIGHPLNEPNPPYERGHLWSYNLADWHAWFTETGFGVHERFLFPMGQYENMVMGHGSRQ